MFFLSAAQPAGQPEVCKTSMDRCSVKGGQEMFIIGRNFPKNSKVIFQEWHNDSIVWQEEANLDKEHFNSVSVRACVRACVRVPRRMVVLVLFLTRIILTLKKIVIFFLLYHAYYHYGFFFYIIIFIFVTMVNTPPQWSGPLRG